MIKFYDVFEDGLATVSFNPSDAALKSLGYVDVFEMSEDLEDMIKANYPDMYFEDECQFEIEGERFMVHCANEDVAEVVNEELVYLIEHREFQMSQVKEFE